MIALKLTRFQPLLLLILVFFPAVAEEIKLNKTVGDQAAIVFGSCLRQWQSQPVWNHVLALSPKAFIFLGDNMYSDVGAYRHQPESERIHTAYRDLAASEDFQSFLDAAKEKNIDLYATWDDHDYGLNDGGEDFPYKLQSKAYFLDFFGLDRTASGGKETAGIYQAHRLSIAGLDTQVILLDTRSFRSELKTDPDSSSCARTNIIENTDADASILGEGQWQWLEKMLTQPADLRLIASSIQVIPEQHCFEKWANFPNERSRLFNLISKTNAEGVILLSGDRHLAEISKLPQSDKLYPLYEVTSSGLNSAMGISGLFSTEDNRYRVGDNLLFDNFAAIMVNTVDGTKIIELQLHRANGDQVKSISVPLADLTF